ncbi:cupin domain-containing protein [Shewanella inventionis]|uniref:cupin domain-containing protein n=1 Tax=Shewanella inventionis TaxID=1738770 RepID=UPI00166B9F6D
MKTLGTLEDLPKKYKEELEANNLVPLWPNMRAVLPHKVPTRNTETMTWRYNDIRPLLIEAGDLTPIEKAERRVLVLANPGHGLNNMQATPSIYMGMQLILPGETAPNHRHTPNAVRIIVEGEGAYTTVNGEPCKMERGDLILTPSGMWHEHHHEGKDPIVWLDILDLPLIYSLEGSWAIESGLQKVSKKRDKSYSDYSAAGIVPSLGFTRTENKTPMLRYPWKKTKSCLLEMAQDYDESSVQVSYVNPENGNSLFPSIGFGALMIKSGQSVTLPKRTTPCIFHVIEGAGLMNADTKAVSFSEKDTFSAPGYVDIEFTNPTDKPIFMLTADESPLHGYLGIF